MDLCNICHKLLRDLFPRFLLALLAVVPCYSQTAQTAAKPDRGTGNASGSYALSDIESINLQNGNVSLSIPLASLPPIAGGKLSFTLRAIYNSKLYDTYVEEDRGFPGEGGNYVYTKHVPRRSTSGGWIIGGAYQIDAELAGDDFVRLVSTGDPDLQSLSAYSWHKTVLITPDGSRHELRPLDYAPWNGNNPTYNGYYKDSANTAGTAIRYYSFDGSYLWAKMYPNGSSVIFEIFLADGTKVTQWINGIQRITDTNGNSIKIFSDSQGTHFQDEQTGREIRYSIDASGVGHVWFQRPTDGVWISTDINWGTTFVKQQIYQVTGPFYDPDQPDVICTRDELYSEDVPVVREIILPQTEPGLPGRKFTFSYNSDIDNPYPVTYTPMCNNPPIQLENTSNGRGQLSEIVTPNGAVVKYTFSSDVGDATQFAASTLTSKQVIHDGITDTWTYAILGTTSTVNNPDGSSLFEQSYFHSPAHLSVMGGSDGFAGLVYRINRSNKELIERHWISLKFDGARDDSPGGKVVFNPVVDKEYRSLLDDQGQPVKMSASAYVYDFNGSLLQQTDYDWFDPSLVSRDINGIPTGIPASATVLKAANNSYYNQATTSASANVYAKRSVATATPLILNALKETTLGPRIVQLSYDGQAYGVAPTVGNLTTKKVWVNLDSKWITTSNTYDLYGNVLTATDGRGKVTQFFYDDATHALPNRIVVDPQNSTGTQTTTTTYDYYTGLVTSQTDVNGQISTIDYTNQLLGTADPFGRPGVTFAPQVNINGSNHKRRVTTTYLDSARQVIVATDVNAENDKLLKTRTTTDQLGRPVLTEQTENGTNYTISVASKYLDMGRVTLTSSAVRSTAATTDQWSRVTKDNAGRVTEVATFGGATQPAWSGTSGVFTGAITTTYNANFTTVTDQAGKVRRSMVDALGRLRRVDEPDASNSLGTTVSPVQPTSYDYDVFGNLTTVTQGSQTRTFSYDSLSRLRTAVNPESGTVSYQYDDNSNLLVKTDARGVSAHFEYDSLNRVTRRWYNGSTSLTATTHNSPALPSGVGTTNEAKFYYDSQALPAGAPSYSRGSAVGRLVAQTYGTGSNGDYYAYDVLGRATLKIQQTGTINYQLSAAYNLSGAISTLTYPSGHTVTNTYDQASRLTSLSGNLGDGITRTYATGILYSPTGGLVKEQFGTTTPVYNKLFYNSRGQLAEIRASTSYTGPTDTTWDRGAIVNSYSNQCTGVCSGSSMSDNNGNLLKQQIYIPSQQMRWQQYDYDSLNRLNWAREVLDGGTEQWKQQFTYDRWGNRSINTGVTYGTGINNKAFTVNTSNNRLGVPVGQSGTMSYDAAGNLTNDTYTGAGNRTYDAENKITSAWGGNNQAQLYSYDASGQRIKRTVDGVETWHVYGFGGELLAEYAASGGAASLQKEYGYRNGQLLITAEGRTNVALSANGAVASASSAHTCCGFSVGGAINGNIRGPWGNGEGWNDATENVLPDWFQVDFSGSKTIDEIYVFSLHDNYTEPNTPTETQTFSLYGLINFQVQYWNGSAWTTIPGGNVSGNNKVWRKFTFAPITTSKIRLWITSVPDAWSRLVELQAWEAAGAVTNLALNKPASQSSTAWDAPAQRGVDGNTDGNFWNGSVTHTATENQPWWQVDLQSVMTIQNINVWNRTDCCGEALTNFYVFVSDNAFTANDVASTQSQPGVSAYFVAGQAGVPSTIGVNRTGRYVRVQLGNNERLSVAEVQVLGLGGAAQVRWLVSDQLGTPRMTLDQSGSLANIRRHDYLPFGEELVAPTSGRSAAQGYSGGDGVRQQFTSKERDVETALDYFLARYYSSAQGRFSSIDPSMASVDIGDPQTFNRYAYVRNNSLNMVDPTGMIAESIEHGGSDYDAEVFSKLQELRHQEQPRVMRQDPKNVQQKPATVIGLLDEIPEVLVINSQPANQLAVSANDGLNDTLSAFSVGGFGASGGQYYFMNPNETMWRGINGKWNNMSWGGNQYTGGRSLAVAKAGAFKVANKAFFFAGAGISGYQGYQNIQQGNYAGAAKNGLDIGMSAAATFGGPYGLAIGGVYFVGDTIGWKNISDSHEKFMRDVERASGMPYRKYMGPIY